MGLYCEDEESMKHQAAENSSLGLSFEPTRDSLGSHLPAPDWFRDAKLGMYFHWGIYSVPAFGSEWYPRWMHFRGNSTCEHHTEKYGDPADFGYHDFVPMFKAEKFDPDEWAELFEKTGARFAGPCAEHHDGFSMWASGVNPWNVKDMGPRRDITGELEKAIRSRGMRFITTFHHARNLQRHHSPGEPYPHPKHYRDSHYPPVKGWPTTSDDPRLCQLYGNLPEEVFLRNWKQKLVEVIDGYNPDIVWFDSWLRCIPEQTRNEFLAYYLNRAEEWGREVVAVSKHDEFLDSGLKDFEKGRMNQLTDYAWLTDDTISTGSWSFTDSLEVKPAGQVLHVLIDIVSKNGQLLLNISPMADGSIPQNQRDVVLRIGKWLDAYGEAIYQTRPWIVFGQGPTRLSKGGGFTHKQDGYLQYTPRDIRFTCRGSTVYAIVLGWPGKSREFTMEAFGEQVSGEPLSVTEVKMLGYDGPVEWQLTDDGLSVTTPDTQADDLAVVFRVVTD